MCKSSKNMIYSYINPHFFFVLKQILLYKCSY